MTIRNGFSLIEVTILIVVMSFALGGIFIAFNTALRKSSGVGPRNIALELANSRMEIILGQRRSQGFGSTLDLCTMESRPSICDLSPDLVGYTITSRISGYTINTDSNYQLIDVLVTGPQGATVDLKALVAGP